MTFSKIIFKFLFRKLFLWLVDKKQQLTNKRTTITDLLREEVIVCLAACFFLMFIQTGFETMLTPLTAELFNWGSLGNSLFFLAAGVDVSFTWRSWGRIINLSNIITWRSWRSWGNLIFKFITKFWCWNQCCFWNILSKAVEWGI